MSDKKNSITMLGTGTSTGVPMIGCQCQVCTSPDTRDRRTRVSAWLQTAQGHSLLVDATPDFRFQALRFGIRSIDSCIITHDHADHTHGLDDLRPLCFFPKTHKIPVYTSAESAESLKVRFPYIFRRDEIFHSGRPILGGGIPQLDLHLVQAYQLEDVGGEEITFFPLPHGHIHTYGFYHRGLAFFTDCNSIPDQTLSWLKKQKVKILFIDCVKYVPHQTHLHQSAAFDYIRAIGPEQAFLIHMSHDMGHAQLIEDCLRAFPHGHVAPAYDGLVLEY